jgi:hypothetical protein
MSARVGNVGSLRRLRAAEARPAETTDQNEEVYRSGRGKKKKGLERFTDRSLLANLDTVMEMRKGS